MKLRRASREDVIAGALLFSAFAVVAVSFYPGRESIDTITILTQARTGPITDWLSPFAAVLFRGWGAVGLGPGTAWLMQIALFVAAVYLLARVRLPRVWAAALAAGLTIWPPDYGQLAALSRDSFFMGFALLSLAALGRAASATEPRRFRIFAVLAVGLAVATFLTRQNGITVIVGVAAVLTGLARHGAWESPARLASRASFALPAVVAMAMVPAALAVGKVFNTTAGVRQVHPERAVYVYDIASISDLSDHDQFPQQLQANPHPKWFTPKIDLATIKAKFDWTNVISLTFDTIADTDWRDAGVAKEESKTLGPAWRDAVSEHPGDYLWTRFRLTAATAGVTHHPTNALLNQEYDFHPTAQFASVRDRATRIQRFFIGAESNIPLDILWPYLAVGLALSVYLWRRAKTLRPMIIAFAVVQWANFVVLFFAAPAAGYGYSNLTVPLTLVLCAWSLKLWLSDRPQRQPA